MDGRQRLTETDGMKYLKYIQAVEDLSGEELMATIRYVPDCPKRPALALSKVPYPRSFPGKPRHPNASGRVGSTRCVPSWRR
jgi:hypothetical protein